MPLMNEIIEKAEQQLADLIAEEAKLRAQSLADGVIDDAEQASLDKIRGKIDKLDGIFKDLRSKFVREEDVGEIRGNESENVDSPASQTKQADVEKWMDTLEKQMDDLFEEFS